ncbi:MAG: hypothetical protein ACFB0B_15465 [Thermonemataceae bacterium]
MTIDQQIEELERELQMRQKVYPNWVDWNRIDRAVADYRLEVLEACIKTLKKLREDKFGRQTELFKRR